MRGFSGLAGGNYYSGATSGKDDLNVVRILGEVDLVAWFLASTSTCNVYEIFLAASLSEQKPRGRSGGSLWTLPHTVAGRTIRCALENATSAPYEPVQK
jgi:hypothetical protein